MIISPGRNFIFVHIPKTGGSSMALALEERAHKDDILIGDTPKAKRRKGRLDTLRPKGRLWKHSTLADIDGIVSSEVLAQMFIFTLVRNPWDRMVSYYHWLRDQHFEHAAVSLAKSKSFEGFVRDAQTAATFQAAPYASYVTDATGQERATTFVRLEALEADLAPVWDHLGFRVAVPHVNRSARPKDYRMAYTDETADIVARICAVDIARFGYHFSA
ncbi:sulfotransferase family protein [Marivita sp. S6314]|uniref:sulfotransferase family 2 domain-containing protein n=1 Tax=Marivita sp. S6314 TaxID=2926406 RepID=UPI001FF5FA9B|nr:sulfotransferase family 2 domain-containing protein [Marivita sp. S6314]MCK0149587.1 sulfotransferase family protein [Marivita sp. S6314]